MTPAGAAGTAGGGYRAGGAPGDLPAWLDQLDEAREKATPGPWYRDKIGDYHNVVAQTCWDVASCHDGGAGEGDPMVQDVQARANADYIAAVHAALPHLTAAVRAALDLADELDYYASKTTGGTWADGATEAAQRIRATLSGGAR